MTGLPVLLLSVATILGPIFLLLWWVGKTDDYTPTYGWEVAPNGQTIYFNKLGRITFKQFLHMYKVNPEAYVIIDDKTETIYSAPLRRYKKVTKKRYWLDGPKNNYTTKETIEYTGVYWVNKKELHRYKDWAIDFLVAKKNAKEAVKNYQEEQVRDENLKVFLDLAQQDINKAQEDCRKAIENYKKTADQYIIEQSK